MNGVVAAIVVAAGRGFRAGGDGPKQYRQIGGEPVIRAEPDGAGGPPGHRGGAAGHPSRRCRSVSGRGGRARRAAAGARRRHPAGLGARRARGLERAAGRISCWCTMRRGRSPPPALIARAIAAARASGAAIPALAVADTVKTVDRVRRRDRHHRPRAAAPGADAAGLRLRASARRASARARPPVARTSPTMRRWPNGPASRSRPSRAKPAT